ncbi:MAG TPA: AMP-binding protein, partial [Phenylobacterium sp.]|nr:AMP-binding protein [Phenylobacterium sp.]
MSATIDFDQMPTLGDIARYHARVRGEAVALQFEGRLTTFAQFDRHTNQVANALVAEGLQVGDRIAYLGKNSDHYFELLIGAAKAGVVMTPIGWRLAPREVAFIAGDAKAPLLFVGPEVADLAAEALKLIDGAVRPIAMEPVAQGWPLYEAWRDAQGDADPKVAVSEQDIAVQLYTSGTTGNPKGAMLRHVNVLGGRRQAAEAKMDWNEWGPQDISLVAMPVAHIGGTGWGIVGLYNGAKGVVAREFDPMKVLDFIERDRCSKMFMVPAALQIVVRQPRAREVDYSRLKYILYGASPIPLDLLRECMEVFGCGFCQQYGMTETCGTIVYLPPEDHDPAGSPRMRAAGLPMPG